MKKLTIALIGLSILIGTIVYQANSAPIQIAGSLVGITNTTAYFGTNIITSPQVSFSVLNMSNGGLSATSACAVLIQTSTDGVNWGTAGTYYFPTTNSGTSSYYNQSTNVNVYLRLAVTTTNAVQFGATYGN